MEISCIIVEDEPLAVERAEQYVRKIPLLRLLSTFNNGIDALIYLRSHKVDLIFLDINMEGISGIQLLETLSPASQVILTTAYHEYALKGFELNVTDYLLKPYTFERFLLAVDKVHTNLLRGGPALVNEKKFVFIKTENRLEKILLGDILYIEGMRDYRKIHLPGKDVMTLKTFTEFEQEIAQEILCRVHKSYMVSLEKINSVEKDLIRINDTVIPISETYKKNFYMLINHPPAR